MTGRLTTRVINIRQENYDLYIGRAGRGYDGYFGNPFLIGRDGTRAEVLKKYEDYFINRMYEDPEFNRRIVALKGKTLGCFCKPQNCHGDIIISWIDP